MIKCSKQARHEMILAILGNADKDLASSDFPLDILQCDRFTLARDLDELQRKHLLTRSGATKGARYRANPVAILRQELSKPPHQREPVAYNPDFLRNYEPNQTFLLTDGDLWRLYEAAKVQEIKNKDAYSRVLAALMIDLSYGSSRLEDVNISWLDTKTLIEFGEAPKGLSPRDLQVVVNHKEAIHFMVNNELGFNSRDLFDLHSLLARGLMSEPETEGRLRSRYVTIEDSAFIPINNPHQLREEFDLFCAKAQQIDNPFEQAFFAMTAIPYLQAFHDCNKRTSRISMNIPLIRNHLCPFSFMDTPKGDYMLGLVAVYEKNDSRILADAFVRGYEATARRYLDIMRVMRMDDARTISMPAAPESVQSQNRLTRPRCELPQITIAAGIDQFPPAKNGASRP